MNTKESRKLEGQKTLLGRTMHSIVYNERRDDRSGALVDRSVIAKVTYMLAF